MFLVSDMDDLVALIHRKRVQIEEGFRDLKSLFVFKHLVLKKATQERAVPIASRKTDGESDREKP